MKHCILVLIAAMAAARLPAAEIHDAAQSGDTAKVIELIKQTPALVSEKDKKGNLPLHLAAEKGWTEIIVALLDAGADVNAKGLDDWTPLHYAAKDGSIGACRVLLQRGAKRDALNSVKQTPQQLAGVFAAPVLRDFVPNVMGTDELFTAVEAGNTEKVKALVAATPDTVKGKDDQGRTPLFLAAYKGNPALMKLLLEAGADVNATDRAGKSALSYACEASNPEAVELLFQFKVAPTHAGEFDEQLILASLHCDPSALQDMQSKFPEATSVVAAAKEVIPGSPAGSESAITATMREKLKSAGFDKQIRSFVQLMKASPELISKRVKIAGLLLEHGANPNAIDPLRGTALRNAVINADSDGLKLLLKHGARPDSDGALTSAVIASRPENIRVLLDAGADPLSTTKSFKSALSTACGFGDFEIVKQLLSAIKDRQRLSADSTLLPSAAQSGQVEIVRLLLDNGASVSAKVANGLTALHWAATTDSVETTHALIAAGADVNVQDDAGYTPLACAVERRNNAQVAALLSHGAKLEVPIKSGGSPLVLAAEYGYLDTVQLLLKAGAKPTAVGEDGTSVIHHAAAAGYQVKDMPPFKKGESRDYAAIVKLLLDAGVPVNTVSPDGWTPLHTAAVGGCVDAARMLLEKGAKLDATINDGRTALHLAAMKGTPEMITLLLDRGAPIDSVQVNHPSKATPLMLAEEGGRAENVKLLLKRGANLQVRGFPNRMSVLHGAAWHNHVEIAKLLLAAGISVDVRDADKGTPLMVAVSMGSREAAALLIEKGADVNAKFLSGDSMLKVATAKGHSAIVSLLKAHGAKN